MKAADDTATAKMRQMERMTAVGPGQMTALEGADVTGMRVPVRKRERTLAELSQCRRAKVHFIASTGRTRYKGLDDPR